MWQCIRNCFREYLPGLGIIIVGLIIVAIIGASAATGGLAAVGIGGFAAIIGVTVGVPSLTLLFRCILRCF